MSVTHSYILEHLYPLEQGAHKYVGCSRFPVPSRVIYIQILVLSNAINIVLY